MSQPTTALIVEGDAQARLATVCLFAVFERQRAAVRFGNLAAENQADARAARLGREKRYE